MRPSCHQSTVEPLIVKVSPGDRRQVHRRFLELSLNAWCSPDGQLHVEINNDVESAQVHSIIRQFIATRAELVNWLEQCWE